MAYTFKYRLLDAPTATSDGSGLVAFSVCAVANVDGGAYTPLLGYDRSIYVPYHDIQVIMDMPHSTGPQKNAKNEALKKALSQRTGFSPRGLIPEWNIEGMTAWKDSLDGAVLQAERVNAYITVALGLPYPLDFSL